MRGALTPHPELWNNFSQEKTVKTSKLLRLIVWNFVSIPIPAGRTNRDVVEQIARASKIPIEALCDDLNKPLYPGSQAIFGFAGDALDKVADNYNNMQWWISETGLNVAMVPSLLAVDPAQSWLDALDGNVKGNIEAFRGLDGELKKLVTVDVAARFGGVGRRAIEKAISNGKLESQGQRRNRRVIVSSLLRYFPSEK
jgi:hypothetical protein